MPLLLALAVPADWLWPVLLGLTAVALLLLALTPGFAWGELARAGGASTGGGRGGRGGDGGGVGAPRLVAGAGAGAGLPRRATGLWLAILALYPLLSALPQELIFRVLFFRRYGRLFAGERAAVAVNALGRSRWRT